MGANTSKASLDDRGDTGLEDHMLWIANNFPDHEETVSRFKRTVSTKSDAYHRVARLFHWQQGCRNASITRPACVADLAGTMRIEIEGVRVNKVDVF